jgi:nucleotidyltransferase substrate binding protein (TIGR01987 family)
MSEDIRWMQRFDNYGKALEQLTKFIEKGELNEFELQGFIQSFEYNYELSWNTIKDYFENQGDAEILGSRDAFRLAFKRGLIENGEAWMDMIKSRALTSHTYDVHTANEIAAKIKNVYYAEFMKLKKRLDELKRKERMQ